MRFKFLIIFIIISVFSSCNVEKRRYLSGYHIEKITSKIGSQKKISIHKKPSVVPNLQSEELQMYTTDDKTNTIAIEKNTPTQEFELSNRLINTLEKVKVDSNQTYTTYYEPQPKVEELKYHWSSIVGIVLGVLSFIPFIGIIIGLLAITFCIIGLRQVKSNPLKYKGESLSKVGIYIAFLGILFSLTLLFIYIVFLSLFF